MKITLKELRSLIRESVRAALRENTEPDVDALIKTLEAAQKAADGASEVARAAIEAEIKRLEGEAEKYSKSPDENWRATSLEVTIGKLRRSLLSKKEQNKLRKQDYKNDLELFGREFFGGDTSYFGPSGQVIHPDKD